MFAYVRKKQYLCTRKDTKKLTNYQIIDKKNEKIFISEQTSSS